jgi:hypothetical protein
MIRPACFDDLLEGRRIVQKIGDEKIEIVYSSGTFSNGITGETYLCDWGWKGRDVGGSRGHVHVRKFRSAINFRITTHDEPRLYVDAKPDEDVMPSFRELLVRLDMAVSGMNKPMAEKTFEGQPHPFVEPDAFRDNQDGYQLSDDAGTIHLDRVYGLGIVAPKNRSVALAWEGSAAKSLRWGIKTSSGQATTPRLSL